MAEPEEQVPEYGMGVPRHGLIIQVANGYRVVWNLGGNLGWAWYSASPSLLEKVWGPDWREQVNESLPTISAFKSKYGNNYWGTIAEISLTAETPWEDLMSRIYSSFGPVPGLETSAELKRLAIQGYFEQWSPQEWITHYHQTEYWNTLNTTQQNWNSISQGERDRLVDEWAGKLLAIYRQYWGVNPTNGLRNADLRAAAERVASGRMDISQYENRTRNQAQKTEGTPAYRDKITEVQASHEQEVTLDNWALTVESLWNEWVGPGTPNQAFKERWAKALYKKTKSEADLLDKLKGMSIGRWPTKPEDMTWEEWASPTISDIEDLLEIGTLDPSDLLLKDILQKGLTGADATIAIRHDARFKQTNKFRDELSSAVADVGRKFGFVPSMV